MSIMESRKHPRYGTKIEATILTQDTKIPALITEISEKGSRIAPEKAMDEGTIVSISLNLKKEIRFKGVVKWLQEFESGSDFSYMIGIEIKNFDFTDGGDGEDTEKSTQFEEVLKALSDSGVLVDDKLTLGF